MLVASCLFRFEDHGFTAMPKSAKTVLNQAPERFHPAGCQAYQLRPPAPTTRAPVGLSDGTAKLTSYNQ